MGRIGNRPVGKLTEEAMKKIANAFANNAIDSNTFKAACAMYCGLTIRDDPGSENMLDVMADDAAESLAGMRAANAAESAANSWKGLRFGKEN